MCGIFGVISQDNVYEDVKPALERLAYRGYDSAGVAALDENKIRVVKCLGHPENLEEKSFFSNIAIGHNRWATHGPPSIENAHPHLSNDKKIALVHNGIIENYAELKSFLKKKGFKFYSDTDTEIFPNLIQYFYKKTKCLYSSINLMSKKVHGAYAIAFIHKDFKEQLNVVKIGSPICIGSDDKKTYVSSDMLSLPISTKRAVAIDDRKIITINLDGSISTKSLEGAVEDLKFRDISISEDQYDLGEYSSFLEKEIYEQVIYSKNVLAGRVLCEKGLVKLSGVSSDVEKILNAEEIIFTGCGSALLAAQIGAYAMETLARKRCRAISAGELKYYNAVINDKTVMIAVSQSGETADTLGCIKNAKNHGATTIGIVNVPNSSISREVSSGIHIRAGQEVSVASTKAVMNQIISMVSLAVLVAYKKDLSQRAYFNLISDLCKIPEIISQTLERADEIREIAKIYRNYKGMICIGRDILEPVAKEAALKIKEISYIHAEGYSASELKHGPLALISESMPTLAFVPHGPLEEKTLSNIVEVKSRGGKVISIISDKCSGEIEAVSDHCIQVPSANSALVSVVPYLVAAQLLALYLASLNNRPIDRPRNLAKSVTVE